MASLTAVGAMTQLGKAAQAFAGSCPFKLSVINDELTPHQREILVAITLNGVPIDVLAERLSTTRGALYKTLHDARGKLRAHLAKQGLNIGSFTESETS